MTHSDVLLLKIAYCGMTILGAPRRDTAAPRALSPSGHSRWRSIIEHLKSELRLQSQETQATAFQRGCGQMRNKPPVTKLLVATAKICLRFYDRQQYMVCLLPAETRSVRVALSLGFARHFVSHTMRAEQT